MVSLVVYKVYKELERQLKILNSNLTPERTIEIAKNIYLIKVKVPHSDISIAKNLFLTEEQKYLAKIFSLD